MGRSTRQSPPQGSKPRRYFVEIVWAHALSAVPPMPTFCFGDHSRHQSIHPAFQRYANKLIP